MPLRRAGHQARRDGHRHRRHPAPWSTSAATAALTPHRGPGVPRLPARRGVRRRATASRSPPATAPARSSPIPTRSPGPPRCIAARRAPGDHRRLRRVLGTAPRPRCARRPRRCGCRCSPTAWAAAACRPTTRWPSAAPAGAAQGRGRRGRRRRHAARLPARLRRLRRRQVVHIVDAPTAARRPRRRRCRRRRRPAHDPRRVWPADAGDRADHEPWISRAARRRGGRRGRRRPGCWRPTPTRSSPTRIYGELRQGLDRDAVIIGDGGDFVSYAGKYLDVVRSPAAGSTPGPTAASAPAWATPWRPGSPTPTGRSAC